MGRETELARLDAAWQKPETHVVTIAAWGGVGKTALVVEWIARMARDGWRGAERVFDWSFCSQGTREQAGASADTFIAAALEFFGGEEGKKLAASPMSGWDKGAKLAQWLAQRRTLLVLDGLEPLQFPPGPVGGKLKDPALEALLKGLAQHNAGLCLVTTREPVADLAPFRDTVSPQWHLEHLSIEAGADLLFQTGVRKAGNAEIKANDKELKEATREVGGHALTLQLLGRYLAKVHNGDVRKRSLVAFRKADAKIQGGHAFRTMAAYEKWLSEAGEEGKRQLAVLHLLGLFDRPADGGCITALRQEPVIDGLTEPLVGLDDDDWNFTLSNLVECGLVSCRQTQSEVSNPQFAVDCHPLIREYFAQQLREKNWDAWRAAHQRLYEYLCANTPDKARPALEDLQPLYQAVAHGCQAELHQEAMLNVYWPRIQRKLAGYSHRVLGAFGVELATLSGFFVSVWTQPSPNLSRFWQAIVWGFTAARLRSLGRLDEAAELFKASLAAHSSQGDTWLAGVRARQLADVYAQLGRLTQAQEQAEEAVSLGDKAATQRDNRTRYVTEGLAPLTRKDIAFERVIQRVVLGGIFRQLGKSLEAEQSFHDAEQLQKVTWPNLPVLFSIWGARYCRLLVGDILGGDKFGDRRYERIVRRINEMRKVRQEARRMRIPRGNWGPLEEALEEEVIALAKARRSRAQRRTVPLDAAADINSAVERLRTTGRQDFICRGLLTRSTLRWEARRKDHLARAQHDLDEAWEIAKRGPMCLVMTDIHLHRARLFGPRKKELAYPWGSPEADLAAARKLIEQCGYHRRDEELADAEEAAKGW